jgi:hypothetical protein
MAEGQTHSRNIVDCLRVMEVRGAGVVEVRRETQDRYNQALQDRLTDTVWNTGGCMSWYIDRNGRNTTLWPGFTWRFRQITRRFDPEKYVLERTHGDSGASANGAARSRQALAS